MANELKRELAALRRRIDALNREILARVQERGEVVLEVAEVKRHLGLEALDPMREEEMLRTLARETSGPFDAGDVREIFTAILRASRRLHDRTPVAETATAAGRRER